MKRILFAGWGLVVCSLTALAAESELVLKDQKDKVSYAFGMDIGSYLKRNNIEVNQEALMSAIRDTIAGAKLQMTEAEGREVMMAFNREMQNKRMEQSKAAGETNKKDGDMFLAANAKKEGVKTNASGLQYQILQSGSGKSPTSNDTVSAHYRGTLIDGTEFDSSYSRGQPFTTAVKGVIPGWTEALQMMKVGDKWRLFIPSNLAYGERGAGGKIGPNAALIFEMELLGVETPNAAQPGQPATSPAVQPAQPAKK